jgi:hypothetical protein
LRGTSLCERRTRTASTGTSADPHRWEPHRWEPSIISEGGEGRLLRVDNRDLVATLNGAS